MSDGRPSANGLGTSLRLLGAHWLFPVAAALWCAALFGLSSLAVSGRVFEAIVVRTGLPAILPPAAPPLGVTARLLLALLLAAVGAGLGLGFALLARRRMGRGAERAGFADAPSAKFDPVVRLRRRDAHPDAPPRRPLVLTEDLLPLTSDAVQVPGVQAAEAPAWAGPERSAAPFAAPFDDDPWPNLPEPQVLATSVTPDDMILDLSDWSAEPSDELSSVVETGDTALATPTTSGFEPAPVSAELAVSANSPQPTILPPVLPHALKSFASAAIPDPLVPGAPRSPLANAPVATLGLVQLIERLALALAERRALREAAVLGVAASASAVAAAGSAKEQAFDALLADPEGHFSGEVQPSAQDWDRFDEVAQPSGAAAPFLNDTAADIGDATPTPPELLLRTKPSRRFAEPRWADDEGEQALATGESEAHFGMPAHDPADPFAFDTMTQADGEGDAMLANDDRYPSLLGLSLSGQSRQIGRTDEIVPFMAATPVEPMAAPSGDPAQVVPFLVPQSESAAVWPLPTAPRKGWNMPSGQTPAPIDPEDADRALRDALDTLKRMTAKG
ncbi:hypothetical protein [Novosphingobium sp.]|uniref:hypothetical protein n=1 Tax=Novosphingobium sp. TaxID=1874826 RepID=UPI0038B84AE6